MVFNKTKEQEKEYLRQIINTINDSINNTNKSVKEHVDTLQEYKEYLWSNKDIDPHEIRSMRESILRHFATSESVIDKRKRLGKILDIPYFGRIDFTEKKEGCETMALYIGIHTFYDPSQKANLIYDWRAPISSMFYDHELGNASYSSPSGEVDGDISLKRQYRIRKGKMEYMIESSLTVHDDILQKELSSNADDKMKNIVTTIQREQNRIIRNEEAQALIIQGVAGSGKTSIALHRIAYLLYTLKGEITSKDILIISPNKVFADYISNVLPELGEETVPETSMEQILSGILDHKYKYQNFFEQVTELLDKPTPEFIERIQYKASFDFISQLEKFVLYMENNYFKATDVKLTKHITVPAEFIDEQFRRFNRYPMRQRFETMTDYILEMMSLKHYFKATTAERNLLKKEIQKMFAGNNDIQVYKDFFTWIGKPEMFKMRKNRTLEYADLAPLAYLHIALEGTPTLSRVKHLLIDEMQDYSPIQYKIIQKLYPCRKTILGDACWRHFPIRQSLWFFHCRYDSESICHGRSNETLQELPIHVRDHEFCTKDSNERRTGSHHPTRGRTNCPLFQEFGRRTFRHLGINCHVQNVDLQIIGDNMQNRDASTRNHRETQIVHEQPLFPIPSEYGFR